mmetsp:Transcript_9685/g.19755  ORF Transcript_9685/g.19755 Transcript_9685/m.19755 type:complete len:271 (-) Transcript_9685:429-1241(-)
MAEFPQRNDARRSPPPHLPWPPSPARPLPSQPASQPPPLSRPSAPVHPPSSLSPSPARPPALPLSVVSSPAYSEQRAPRLSAHAPLPAAPLPRPYSNVTCARAYRRWCPHVTTLVRPPLYKASRKLRHRVRASPAALRYQPACSAHCECADETSASALHAQAPGPMPRRSPALVAHGARGADAQEERVRSSLPRPTCLAVWQSERQGARLALVPCPVSPPHARVRCTLHLAPASCTLRHPPAPRTALAFGMPPPTMPAGSGSGRTHQPCG